MTRPILALTSGMLLIALAATQVSAQGAQNCAPREIIIERLADRYGETRQSLGLGANNSVVEVFASPETGSWTITVTLPSGVTCLIAAGQSYEAVAETLAPRGNDA